MKQPLRGLLGYLLATAVFLIALIAAGLFDPEPVGELQTTLPASSLTIEVPGQTIRWLENPLPTTDFSVRATAVWQSGSQDSGVGIALGGKANPFVVALSPLGYVMVQQDDTTVLPWQPWPHVRLAETPNEIWIDVVGNDLTVRLNRELLWQGSHELTAKQLGIFSENFGETAVYNFQSIEIFGP